MSKKAKNTLGTIEFIARGVLRRGHSVLLCRNLKSGYFYLPGGHVERGESSAAALRREFREETGLRVVVAEPCLLAEVRFNDGRSDHHEVNMVFHMQLAASEIPDRVVSRERGIGFEWVDLAAVVDSDLRPPVVKAWLLSKDAMSGAPVWVADPA